MPKPDVPNESEDAGEADGGENEPPKFEDVFRDGLITAAQTVQSLLHELLKLGGDPSDLRYIVNNAKLREQVAALIIKHVAELQQAEEFDIQVDYNLSLHRLITVANFDEVDKAVHKAKFEDLITGPPKKLVARMIRPGHPMPPQVLIAEAKKIPGGKWRAADAKAHVVFVTTYPSVQLQHPVFGLGSIGRDPEGGQPVALCATTDLESKKRVLMAEEVNVDMDPVNFILIVRDADGSEPQEA